MYFLSFQKKNYSRLHCLSSLRTVLFYIFMRFLYKCINITFILSDYCDENMWLAKWFISRDTYLKINQYEYSFTGSTILFHLRNFQALDKYTVYMDWTYLTTVSSSWKKKINIISLWYWVQLRQLRQLLKVNMYTPFQKNFT